MSDYYDKCRRSVVAHAEVLQARVKGGQINAGAVPGLLEGFLDQPCFYPEWRADLLAAGLAVCGDERTP